MKEYQNEDEELILLIQESNEAAKNELIDKYYYLIKICLNKNIKAIRYLELDLKELTEEMLVTLSKAVDTYQNEKEGRLGTYISACLENKMKNIINKNNSIKHKTQIKFLSLENTYIDTDLSLGDIISDNNKQNPLNKLVEKEKYQKLMQGIETKLTNYERKVLKLWMENDSQEYKILAKKLNTTPKSIDNAIQRIRNKIKKYLY